MATDVAFTLPKVSFTAGTEFLTVDQLRDYVTTSLSDELLQVLLDAAWQSINEAIGPPADLRMFMYASGGDLLWLPRRAESIVAVTEDARNFPITLDATDYELMPSGLTLVRKHTGTTPRWSWWGRVDVTMRAFDDMANRIRVAIELVKLDVNASSGAGGVLTSQTIGTWSETYSTSGGSTYVTQRADILASLTQGMGIV